MGPRTHNFSLSNPLPVNLYNSQLYFYCIALRKKKKGSKNGRHMQWQKFEMTKILQLQHTIILMMLKLTKNISMNFVR